MSITTTLKRASVRTIAIVAIALASVTSVASAYAASVPTNTEYVAPALNQRVVFVGGSVQGRRLDTTCSGDGPQLVVVVGGMHTGGEAVTISLAEEIAVAMHTGELIVPPHVRLCVLPTLNADGYHLGRRTNANDVDLNRNWPAANWASATHHAGQPASGGPGPLSEPETMSLWAYVTAARPAAVVVWHCCGGLVEPNGAGAAPWLASAYADGADLTYVSDWTMYPITGQFIDAMEEFGLAAIDVELRTTTDAAYAQHRAGLEALMHQLALPLQ
jgi:predicted deacylase